MERRRFIAGFACGLPLAAGGVLGQPKNTTSSSNQTSTNLMRDSTGDDGTEQGSEGDNIETEFALHDANKIDAEGSPQISVEEGTIYVQGTITYNSSGCGTAELAHVGYEETQARVDVIVVAADDDTAEDMGCTMDVAKTGYQAAITVDGEFSRIAATEHSLTGTNSSSRTVR